MGDFVSFVLGAIGLYIAVRITMIPMQILDELKRQGQLREEADRRIVALLSLIARGDSPLPQCDDSASRLQALADAKAIGEERSCKFG